MTSQAQAQAQQKPVLLAPSNASPAQKKSEPRKSKSTSDASSGSSPLPAPSPKTELDQKQFKKYLDMGLDNLLEVSVSIASKKEESAACAPNIVNVVTEEEILQRQDPSVAEALSHIPGLYFLNNHINYNLGIRGITGGVDAQSNIIQLMINGFPVSIKTTMGNLLGLDLIPMLAVKKIEIIRGPASSIYGANAFLGAINIITQSGADYRHSEAAVSSGITAGNFSFGVSGAAGYGNHTFQAFAAASYYRINRSGLSLPSSAPRFTEYQSQESQNDISGPISAIFTSAYSPVASSTISTTVGYQELDADGEFFYVRPFTHFTRINLYNFYADIDYRQRLLNNALTLFFQTGLTQGGPTSKDQIEIGSDFYYLKRHFSYLGFSGKGEGQYSWVHQHPRFEPVHFLLGADYDYTLHELPSKVEVLKQDSAFGQTGDEVINDPAGEKGFTNIGVYANLSGGLKERLTLSTGLRYDHHSVYGGIFNYRIAGVYDILGWLFIKAMYGTSFKAPSAYELYTKRLYPGGIVGNRDLNPQKAKTHEIQLGARPTPWFSSAITFFYNRVVGKVEFIKYGEDETAMNLSELRSFGSEVEVLVNKAPFSFRSFFSFQNTFTLTEDPFLKGKYDQINDNYVLFPSVMAGFNVNYILKIAYLNFNLGGKYIGTRYPSESNLNLINSITVAPLDPYFILNFTISTHGLRLLGHRQTKAALRMDNLFGSQAISPDFNGIDVPDLGRVIWFTLTQEF